MTSVYLSNQKEGPPFTKIEKTVEADGKIMSLSLDQLQFEKPTKHPSRDVKQATGYLTSSEEKSGLEM